MGGEPPGVGGYEVTESPGFLNFRDSGAWTLDGVDGGGCQPEGLRGRGCHGMPKFLELF